jgi:hypothetical protein
MDFTAKENQDRLSDPPYTPNDKFPGANPEPERPHPRQVQVYGTWYPYQVQVDGKNTMATMTISAHDQSLNYYNLRDYNGKRGGVAVAQQLSLFGWA